jgi:glutathione S-transferase
MESAPLPFFIKPVVKGIVKKVDQAYTNPEIKTHLDFIEGVLTESTWLAGESFTAADIQVSFPLEAGTQRAGLEPGTYPKLQSFLSRIKERPAYQRAVEKGGPSTL